MDIMTENKQTFFIEVKKAPRVSQMEGLETTVLTGLHGERMMMVLNATLPGCTVPIHSHPHEQIGVVYRGEALLRIGDEERHDTALGDEPFIMLDIFYPVREDFIEKCG